jgi:hypothetical protein
LCQHTCRHQLSIDMLSMITSFLLPSKILGWLNIMYKLYILIRLVR